MIRYTTGCDLLLRQEDLLKRPHLCAGTPRTFLCTIKNFCGDWEWSVSSAPETASLHNGRPDSNQININKPTQTMHIHRKSFLLWQIVVDCRGHLLGRQGLSGEAVADLSLVDHSTVELPEIQWNIVSNAYGWGTYGYTPDFGAKWQLVSRLFCGALDSWGLASVLAKELLNGQQGDPWIVKRCDCWSAWMFTILIFHGCGNVLVYPCKSLWTCVIDMLW